MQTFVVPENTRVYMISRINADYNLRVGFRRKRDNTPYWEVMGKPWFPVPDRAEFQPFNENTTWSIACETLRPGSWTLCKDEYTDGGGGTNLWKFMYDDDHPHKDQNDAIVFVSLGSPLSKAVYAIVDATEDPALPIYDGTGELLEEPF